MVDVNKARPNPGVPLTEGHPAVAPSPPKDFTDPVQQGHSEAIYPLMRRPTAGESEGASFRQSALSASPGHGGQSTSPTSPHGAPRAGSDSKVLRRLAGELPQGGIPARTSTPIATPVNEPVSLEKQLEIFRFSPAEIGFINGHGAAAMLTKYWPTIRDQNTIMPNCTHALVLHALDKKGIEGLAQLFDKAGDTGGPLWLARKIEEIGADHLLQSRSQYQVV